MRDDYRPPMVAKLDSQFRFQIPSLFRELYNLSPGDVIEIPEIKIVKKGEEK